MQVPLDPIIFEIGPLALRWYGILLVAGMVAATTVASRYVERKGQDGNDMWDMFVAILIPALIGARLYYVFIQSPRGPGGLETYLANPLDIFKIWEGGIHIFGGIIFGVIAVYVFARIRKIPMLVFLDGIALGMPLGQAIGRIANFVNQELYGPPTTLPFGLDILSTHRIYPYNDMITYPETTRFHPLFLYESVWNFIGFFVIFWISRRFADRLKTGDILLMYLIWYPLGRFFIEFLRTDSWFFADSAISFNVVHIISAICVIVSAALLYLRHGRGSTGGKSVKRKR